MKANFSVRQLAWRGLTFHRLVNLALALGVIAGTAVLTGALLVGDSVRGSLQHLVLDGLGRINHVLVVDRFFNVDLAKQVNAVPAILLQSTITLAVSHDDSPPRADRVTVLGCNRSADLQSPESAHRAFNTPLASDEIILNEPLAAQLGAKEQSEVIVRLPTPSDVPRDSPLGRKTETISVLRLKVKTIVPATGLGRFSLHPNQVTTLNAFVAIEPLANALRQEGKVNALFSAGPSADAAPSAAQALNDKLQPSLADLGLFARVTDKKYLLFGSQHMLLDPAAEQAAEKIVQAAGLAEQPSLTYLANYITVDQKGKIPYSTITAVDPLTTAPLGPFVGLDGRPIEKIEEGKILLNRWAFDDLTKQGVHVEPGDDVELTYFEPESTHGRAQEQTTKLKLQAIVELAGATDDRDFTPELKGVTDEASIAAWDPPFPYDSRRVRSTKPNDIDEQYWDRYRATPKGFVSLATGRKLWASRFGRTTTIRVALDNPTRIDELSQRWRSELDVAALGFTFRPLRYQALAAATGTTPFNLLFLGFSMFIIAAAVMLVALLFRLNVERRAPEIGILLATGWEGRQVRRLLLGEGLVIAALAGIAGVAVGVGYAWLMLVGLRTWWLAAVTAPFLELHVTGMSVAIGYLAGVGISLSAIAWALRHMRDVSARQLLSGHSEGRGVRDEGRASYLSLITYRLSLAVALVLFFLAMKLGGEAQAGAFFGVGALTLTALLTALWQRLRRGSTGSFISSGPGAIVRLALRNASRHPSRSTLTIGLVASATFLIVAISAFRLDPPTVPDDIHTGTGGFTFLAESSLPILLDLNDTDARLDLGFREASAAQFEGTRIDTFRVQPGDDASCLNLYQPQQPRVLGATSRFLARGGFQWGAVAAHESATDFNPWTLLERPLNEQDDQGREVVPVVIDAATAMFSLRLSGVGARFTIVDDRREPVTLEIVGLLKNSLFQGSLIVSEARFLQHFPQVSGYQTFLISTPHERQAAVEKQLRTTLNDYGLSVRPTIQVLGEFLAVQNTYLSTFQSLGGLGLLLGTFGVATVQLRNVFERRGELALLRAVGFRQALLARLVLYENASLLLGGLFVGTLAAGIAIAPHIFFSDATIPWQSLGLTLGTVIVAGLVTGLIAVAAMLRTPLLIALREP